MCVKFKVNDIEFKIIENPINSGPMIARVDGKRIDNRKAVCRAFLMQHGWKAEDFGVLNTNELERKINKMLGAIPYRTKYHVTKKNDKIIKNESITTLGGVILMNKPFLGGYLNDKGNIGHEIIDFLKTDSGEYYIYNNPWGICPDNIWIEGTKSLIRNSKEKYIGKYMILTSPERNKDFDILYVIELEEKLHRYHKTKDAGDAILLQNQNSVKKIMEERNITYNGKYLNEIYLEDDSLYVTFKGKKIYKAIEPIAVSGLEYNFQRNKGYLYENKFLDDYNKVLNLIKESIDNKKLVAFEPRSVNKSMIGEIYSHSTFLDLICLRDNEQVFTNMLYNVLNYKDLMVKFCNHFKGNKLFNDKDIFSVFRENKIVDGRMDICANGKTQRIIIENKVYSGLNGLKPEANKTQLSTYYSWGKKREIEPLCFVIAPDFRLGEIKSDIIKLDPLMADVYSIISYGQIANFIELEYKNGYFNDDYEFFNLLPQIINAFRNLSNLTKEDLYAKMFLDATKSELN